MAWAKRSKYRQEWLANLITAKRFEDVLRALHWINTAAMTTEEKDAARRLSAFWQVDGLIESVAANCMLYFYLGQNLDLDEMVVYFKGRHIAKCYNASKPEKWHLKFFAINDSSTGYLYNFYPYQGATERRPRNGVLPPIRLTNYFMTEANFILSSTFFM